jgi:predicted tellurium resistance membrane protein TerC
LVFDPRVLLTAEGLASLLGLAVMEVVLGIDNVILVAVLSQKVAPAQRKRVRRLGIGLALIMRVALLLTLSWIMSLTTPLLRVLGHGFSGRDLVLLVGGLFLMAKATRDLHERVETSGVDVDVDAGAALGAGATAGFGVTLVEILLFDIVFSLDSVITAIGMARAVVIMITAMMIAVGVMLVFADAISDFIARTPSMKVLALAFLLLIGVLLVADAFGHHVDKGYVYFAMAFALGVELTNMRARKRTRAPKGNR